MSKACDQVYVLLRVRFFHAVTRNATCREL